MRIWKREIDGKEVMFVNQSRDTRHGFAHDTTMFVDGREITSSSCHYLNRTWECYQYQSVMLSAVNFVIKAVEYGNEQELKEKNGWKKMTPPRKEELKQYNKTTEMWNFYHHVYDALNERGDM